MTASNWIHIKNFHLPYLREFHKLGWKVHLACAGVPDNIPYVDESINLQFQKKIYSLENFKAAKILRNKYKIEKYDLIITHTSLAAFFTRLALKKIKADTKVVNTVHGYLFDDTSKKIKRYFFLSAERFLRAETDLLLLMNSYDYNLAIKYKLAKKIVQIPGIGVDFSKFDDVLETDRQNLRDQYQIPYGAFVLIFAAEFSIRKNQKFLINLMNKLPENVFLILPGEGKLLEKSKKYAEKVGLKNKIIFPGFVQNMANWYKAADLAISPSRSEGLPFNIIEAMYMNLPIVASAVKGHIDLLKDSATAKLYPYNDAEKCLECIKFFMNKNKNMVINNKEIVEKYSLNLVLPQLMNLYLEGI